METTRPSLLLRLKSSNDQAAWYEFDSIYRPLLCRFAKAKGLRAEEAEEIAQECMTALTRYIESFEYDPQKGKFKAWLRTMVNNRIINLRRGRREVQAETRDFRELHQLDEAPDELFDKLWRQQHLKHCLRLVKSEVEKSTFKVFVAYVLEERPIEEVCREYDMTSNQVHAIKSRMTKRLSRRMVELSGGED